VEEAHPHGSGYSQPPLKSPFIRRPINVFQLTGGVVGFFLTFTPPEIALLPQNLISVRFATEYIMKMMVVCTHLLDLSPVLPPLGKAPGTLLIGHCSQLPFVYSGQRLLRKFKFSDSVWRQRSGTSREVRFFDFDVERSSAFRPRLGPDDFSESTIFLLRSISSISTVSFIPSFLRPGDTEFLPLPLRSSNRALRIFSRQLIRGEIVHSFVGCCELSMVDLFPKSCVATPLLVFFPLILSFL